MQALMFLAVILGSIILGIAVIGAIILLAIRMLKGGVSKSSREKYNQEARIIQEVYQGLSKMEKRVDALETLIFDPNKESKE